MAKGKRNFQIEADARELGRLLKNGLDAQYGGTVGFTLFLFELGEDGWFTYLSSAHRDDMIQVVEEWLKKVKNVPGDSQRFSN